MIKQRLKDFDIKISDFAKILQLSRPTLDSYILQFEAGNKIPKDKYDIIFNRLFKGTIQTKEEFNKELNKYGNMLRKEKLLNTYEFAAKETDLITSIMNATKRDLKKGEYDEEFYKFILMMIRGHREQPVYHSIGRYFLLLNGRSAIDSIIEEEKCFLSNFFDFMSKTVNNEIYFNEISYNQFINRIEEINKLIKQEQIKFKKELEEKVNNSIANIILEKHEQGEPLNNIKLNVKDIIPELMKK